MQKSALLSKTLWVNLIMALLPFFGLTDKFSPEQLVSFMALVNMILRFATKDKIVLK